MAGYPEGMARVPQEQADAWAVGVYGAACFLEKATTNANDEAMTAGAGMQPEVSNSEDERRVGERYQALIVAPK